MSGYNGSGQFSFTYSWVNDAANGIPITASRMDTQFADAVGGFDLAMTRDGQGAATAVIPFAFGLTSGDTVTVTSASANALTVGLAGAVNPAFQVDASTASSATGVKIKSAAAAGSVAISTVSSGTNESLKIDAKGTGTITLGGVSTGVVAVGSALTVNTSGLIGSDANEIAYAGGSKNGVGINDTSAASGSNFMVFRTNASALGSISNNGNTAVAFNTTSDMRLKDHVGQVSTEEVFDKLQARTFSWKSTGAIESGFFAQEVHELIPGIVNVGHGKPGDEDFIPWTMDKSGLIPFMWAEIVSLRKRVAELEAKP